MAGNRFVRGSITRRPIDFEEHGKLPPQAEVWKDIPNYESIYQISNFGRVKSLQKIIVKKNSYGTVIFPEKVLHPIKDKGYLHVNLYKNKKLTKIRIHRLVGTVFIPNPTNKPFINHKDGIKTNNNFLNLEWCTAKENSEHASLHGLIAQSFGENNGAAKLTTVAVEIIRNKNSGFTRKELAETYSVSIKHIDRVRSGERWLK